MLKIRELNVDIKKAFDPRATPFATNLCLWIGGGIAIAVTDVGACVGPIGGEKLCLKRAPAVEIPPHCCAQVRWKRNFHAACPVKMVDRRVL